jgi:hypothetical protein
MNVQDPKTKAQQEKEEKSEKKSMAFDPGQTNNSNTQTGTANSGYDEKNPRQPGGTQQDDPKVTNQENDITNSEEQNKWSEEPVEEKAIENTSQKTDQDKDAPLPDPEKTERIVPTMKGE